MGMFDDWRKRVEDDLVGAQQALEQKQQLLERLKQVHQQALDLIDSGSTVPIDIPGSSPMACPSWKAWWMAGICRPPRRSCPRG